METYSPAFLDELQESLGKQNFQMFQDALQPAASTHMPRGKPPSESGRKPIKPKYILQRARTEGDDGGLLGASLASTTRSLSGHASNSRFLDSFGTKYGQVPSYMFEDREKVRAGWDGMGW